MWPPTSRITSLPPYRQVVIEELVEMPTEVYALCRDGQQRSYKVDTRLVKAKADEYVVGEIWIIEFTLGYWTFFGHVRIRTAVERVDGAVVAEASSLLIT